MLFSSALGGWEREREERELEKDDGGGIGDGVMGGLVMMMVRVVVLEIEPGPLAMLSKYSKLYPYIGCRNSMNTHIYGLL